MACKPPMLVRVALANKMARVVWALMAKWEVYRIPVATTAQVASTARTSAQERLKG